MKYVVLILLFISSAPNVAQQQLLGVDASIAVTPTHIKIEQHLKVTTEVASTSIVIKALQFKANQVAVISARASNEDLHIDTLGIKGLLQLELSSKTSKPIEEIVVSYRIVNDTPQISIPMFFTDLEAASSDRDFFDLNIQLPKSQDYIIHFPTVNKNETTGDAVREIAFNMPALPSVIRMELLSGNEKTMRFVTKVDIAVALIFVGIGYVIWRKRRHLLYV